MISGKGILYTVLAATAAAVFAGSMWRKGERGQFLQKIGGSLENILGKKRISQVEKSAHQAD